MIIDLILDRADGAEYEPREFYFDCMMYGRVGEEITRALDSGNERAVKRALCNYVEDQGYNPEICDYIKSVRWL